MVPGLAPLNLPVWEDDLLFFRHLWSPGHQVIELFKHSSFHQLSPSDPAGGIVSLSASLHQNVSIHQLIHYESSTVAGGSERN